MRTVTTNITAQRLHARINCCAVLITITVLIGVGARAQEIMQQVGVPPPTEPDTMALRPSLGNGSHSTSGSFGHTSLSGSALPAESLGNDDLLQITVPYCPELSDRFRVGSDGKLALPLLSQSIQAAGLTPAQLAAEIKEALLREQIMANPSVNIAVLEYRSRTVIVLGAVLHPLAFQATGDTTLLDAIAMAGGLSPSAGKTIVVVSHRVTPQGILENVIRTVNVQDLVVKAHLADNLQLHGGEEIRVPEIGKIFVTGNVVHPGMYAMQGDGDTTVLKALALSQGLQAYTTSLAYIYRRPVAGGEREEISIPLSRIIARKERDVPLLPDDIFYVPEAKGKRMTAKILSQISGFGQTTATGLLIYK
jgi:polysaccharide export outer membrane protein